jgi:diguanylate cyclase (GGDEF)-like protein
VARVGGDEFVVILGEAGTQETAAAVASRIEDAVTESYQVGPDVVRIGASVGVAHGTPAETVAEVIARADDAMYVVKRTREAARP